MSQAPTAPETGTALQEVAYYHEPYWGPDTGDWIKSLLLFFDGIALLVPDYMRERPLDADPTLAQPLAEQGLLHMLSPESLIEEPIAQALAELLGKLLSGGAFDNLDRNTAFAELSSSRLGLNAGGDLSRAVLRQLQEQGLARRSEDGVSVPLHPLVRTFVLVTLPQ